MHLHFEMQSTFKLNKKMENKKLIKPKSFREKISWKIAYGLKPLYFFMRKNRKPWNITLESISEMPEGTLGNDIALFLKKHKLKLMPKAEFHDTYHVLFDYGTDIKEEACVQFVPLGNGKTSLPYLACTFVSALFYPEYWRDFYKAYQIGKKANTFHHWDFELLLHMETIQVRKMIFEKNDLTFKK